MTALAAQPSLELGAELAGGLWRHGNAKDDAALSRRTSVLRHPTGKSDDILVSIDFKSCHETIFNSIRLIKAIRIHVWGDLLGLYVRSVRRASQMSNHRRWLNRPQYFDDISAENYIHEQIRHKRINDALKLSAAISALAAEIGASPWTITNIYRGRIKALRGKMRDAILRHKIEFLAYQLEAIAREINLARQMGLPLGETDNLAILAEVEAVDSFVEAIKRRR